MRIDCNLYSKSIESVRHLFDKNLSRTDIISNLMIATGAPIIVCCQYALQFKWPDDKDLLRLKEKLIDFYKYTEIVPFEDKK